MIFKPLPNHQPQNNRTKPTRHAYYDYRYSVTPIRSKGLEAIRFRPFWE